MRLLLDTCALLWLAAEPERLGPSARTLANDPANDLVLSDVSVLETTLKWHSGKLILPLPPRRWLEDQRKIWRLAPLPLSLEHIYRVAELPAHHRDPFDRLLVSQALTEDLTLLTPDPDIARYPVAVAW